MIKANNDEVNDYDGDDYDDDGDGEDTNYK